MLMVIIQFIVWVPAIMMPLGLAKDFVHSVRSGNEPGVTGVAGRQALVVAEAINHAMQDTNRLSKVGRVT